MRLPPLSLAVLDTETTGFVPRADRIIELAIVRVADGEVTDTWEQLFSIGDGSIPPHVQVLTRIRPANLAGKPSFGGERAAIEERLRGVDLLVGQNLAFDLGMLKGEGIDLTGRPWVDTSLLASLVFPEFKSYSLPYMSGMLRLTHEPAHRALGDVRATLELLAAVWERLLELPGDQMAEAKDVMERSAEGYRLLFGALPVGGSGEAAWLKPRARRSIVPVAGGVTAEKPKRGTVELKEEGLRPSFLQELLNAAVADTSTVHWIAVKNLEATLQRLHLPPGVRALHPPHLLLNPASVSPLRTQDAFTPEEATLVLKLLWFKPATRFEIPVHGAEREVWSGRLACAASSEAYRAQFENPASVFLLDHRQLLSFLSDPDSAADGGLSGDVHVIVDDASMLEDTASKAFGHRLAVEDLRAAAQGDPVLQRFTDLLALWAEMTRGQEDQHFVTAPDLARRETKALVTQARELLATELPAKTQEQLKAVLALLDPAILDTQLCWIERHLSGALTLVSAPRHVDTLLADLLYRRFPTTLLVPKDALARLPEIVSADVPVRSAPDGGRSPLRLSFPTEKRLAFYLKDNPPPGKTVLLLPSKRMIEQAFVDFAEGLEGQGVALFCQGFSGGQGRLEADFAAAESPAILLVTPYLYEGMDLPEGAVDRLILETVPFDSPNIPLIRVRKDRYRDGFNEYCLPRVLHRLFRIVRTFCRHAAGGAEVLVLDARLFSRDYGARVQKYLASLAQSSEPVIGPGGQQQLPL